MPSRNEVARRLYEKDLKRNGATSLNAQVTLVRPEQVRVRVVVRAPAKVCGVQTTLGELLDRAIDRMDLRLGRGVGEGLGEGERVTDYEMDNGLANGLANGTSTDIIRVQPLSDNVAANEKDGYGVG